MFKNIKKKKDLIGKKVKFSIGEPWNFHDKNKILEGNITEISNDEDKNLDIKDWVLCKVTPFKIDNINNKIDMVYCRVRHYGFNLFDELMNYKSVSCNFPYDRSGKELTVDRVRKAELEKNPENFGWLIGGIKIIDYTK